MLKPPFPYVGSKVRCLDKIIPNLPVRKTYVEVFGGTGVVLLNKPRSRSEVFTDLNPEIVNLYYVIRDRLPELLDTLMYLVHSRKQFNLPIEGDQLKRAARWLYKRNMSYSGVGTAFSRLTGMTNNRMSGTLHRLGYLKGVSHRLQGVVTLSQNWERTFAELDSPETVFYCDPPYVDTGQFYGNWLTRHQHECFISSVRRLKGYCAVSGYANSIYDQYDWDDRIEWKKRIACARNPEKQHMTEVLWIKE